MSERKVQLSITIDPELVEWIDREIRTKTFASRSHAIERALHELMRRDRRE